METQFELSFLPPFTTGGKKCLKKTLDKRKYRKMKREIENRILHVL